MSTPADKCTELRDGLLVAARGSARSALDCIEDNDLTSALAYLRAATKQVTEARLAGYIGRLIARDGGGS